MLLVNQLFSQTLSERLLNVDPNLEAKTELENRKKNAENEYSNYAQKSPEEQIRMLDELANSNTTFTKPKEAISFSESIATGKRNCFGEGNSMKYLGENIELLKAEKHIIVRWNIDEKFHINYNPITEKILSDAELDFKYHGNVYVLKDDQIVAIEYQHGAMKKAAEGNYKEALLYYDKSEKLDSTNDLFYFNKANTLRKMGLIEESFELYSKAIELNHYFAEAYFNRAIVWEEMHPGVLSPDYQKAYDLDPSLNYDLIAPK